MNRKLSPNYLRAVISSFCLVMALNCNLLAASNSCPAFDTFEDIGCEDVIPRLNNYDDFLRRTPDAQATIIVYEGKYSKGRNPRRGEARARAVGIKDYLVRVRGVDAGRIVMVDGGYLEEFTVQLYVCPRGFMPTASLTLSEGIKFMEGKISKRKYRWSCLG